MLLLLLLPPQLYVNEATCAAGMLPPRHRRDRGPAAPASPGHRSRRLQSGGEAEAASTPSSTKHVTPRQDPLGSSKPATHPSCHALLSPEVGCLAGAVKWGRNGQLETSQAAPAARAGSGLSQEHPKSLLGSAAAQGSRDPPPTSGQPAKRAGVPVPCPG